MSGRYSEDIPPLVYCAHCGDPRCAGDCLSARDASEEDGLPWERPPAEKNVSPWAALLSTARLVTAEPMRALGGISSGPLLPALHFAVCVELLAVGSLVPLALLTSFVLFPDWTRNDLFTRHGLVAICASWVALALLLVALHVAFGGAVEYGLGRAQRSGAGRQWRRSLRFALYACGWDLWSSPFGWLTAVASRGVEERVALFREAQISPRRSLEHYLASARGVDPRQRRVVVGWCVLFSLPTAFVGVFAWMFTTWWALLG